MVAVAGVAGYRIGSGHQPLVRSTDTEHAAASAHATAHAAANAVAHAAVGVVNASVVDAILPSATKLSIAHRASPSPSPYNSSDAMWCVLC